VQRGDFPLPAAMGPSDPMIAGADTFEGRKYGRHSTLLRDRTGRCARKDKFSRPCAMSGRSPSANHPEVARPADRARFSSGDRVAAARNMETPKGLWIPVGSEGTITEDRGSALVVFFHHQTPPTSLRACDVRKLPHPRA
jgi:hypothetical protein